MLPQFQLDNPNSGPKLIRYQIIIKKLKFWEKLYVKLRHFLWRVFGLNYAYPAEFEFLFETGTPIEAQKFIMTDFQNHLKQHGFQFPGDNNESK